MLDLFTPATLAPLCQAAREALPEVFGWLAIILALYIASEVMEWLRERRDENRAYSVRHAKRRANDEEINWDF